MVNSLFMTGTGIVEHGSGGGVVSFHELNALKKVSDVKHVFQRVGQLIIDVYQDAHKNLNPFMYDYYVASLLPDPKDIELAHFYGSSYTVTMKRLYNATKFATIPAHDQALSLEEWLTFPPVITPPPPHLTIPFLFNLFLKGLIEEVDHIICPSTSSAEWVKTVLERDAIIIPHGLDLPDSSSSHRKGFNVFHIGQFGPDKGQKYLLQAWKLLEKPNRKLIIAGNTTVKTVLAPLLKLSFTTINYSGYISEKLKTKFYRKASVYVQPSVTEGWGLPVGEAMGHGTPVIVTEGVGAKDMVEDGKDGFIVPIRNPEALADKIEYFIDNPSEVKRMGRNARRKAEDYAWENIEKQYEELYLEHINK